VNIVVQDANILIDLLNAELLDLFFQLPCDNHITDLVLAEIQTPKLSASQKSKLTSHSLDPTELNEVLGLRQDAHKLSIPDCSVVWLSQQLGLSTILLSGDSQLRRFAESQKIKVCGLLWVFDELVNHGYVSPKKMASILQNSAFRLPHDECEKRIEMWKTMK